MPLTSAAQLAAFAQAADGRAGATRATYLTLSAPRPWDAVIACAAEAGAISRQTARRLSAIPWSEDFFAFVAPGDALVRNAAQMRAVPAGAFIAFIQVEQADAAQRAIAERDGSVPQGRRHLIHAMLSLGNGLAAGNRNSSIGIGNPVGWQVLDLAGSLNWIDGDPRDAVNAVPLGINRSRPLRVRFCPLERHQAPDTLEPQVVADLARLRALQLAASPGSILALVLGDVIAASALVREPNDWSALEARAGFTEVTNGGHATAIYDPATGQASNYRIHYVWGNLGSLVHELTHVVVNQAYGRDFANAEIAPSAAMPAPVLNALGVRGNELDRQDAWFRAWPAPDLDRTLDELLGLRRLMLAVDDRSEFGKRKARVLDSLLYGSSNVVKEHDTVLNQILVWIHVDWQLAAAPEARAFVDELESLCRISRARRLAAQHPPPPPPPPPPLPPLPAG